jgi:hypothetical protein
MAELKGAAEYTKPADGLDHEVVWATCDRCL